MEKFWIVWQQSVFADEQQNVHLTVFISLMMWFSCFLSLAGLILLRIQSAISQMYIRSQRYRKQDCNQIDIRWLSDSIPVAQLLPSTKCAVFLDSSTFKTHRVLLRTPYLQWPQTLLYQLPSHDVQGALNWIAKEMAGFQASSRNIFSFAWRGPYIQKIDAGSISSQPWWPMPSLSFLFSNLFEALQTRHK